MLCNGHYTAENVERIHPRCTVSTPFDISQLLLFCLARLQTHMPILSNTQQQVMVYTFDILIQVD